MEKFEGNKEPFVPEEKQEEFAVAARVGDMRAADSEEMEAEAKLKEKMRKASLGVSATATAIGVAGAVTGNPLTGIAGALTGIGAALNAKALKKEVKLFSSSAETGKKQSEEAYARSREIVTDEMLKGGAAPVAQREDGLVTPELNATPEQIEIARKEMEEKYGGGGKS